MKDYIKRMLNCSVVLLMATIIGYSQNQAYFDGLKNEADFVFEGEIIKSTGKWNSSRSLIYTEHKIVVSKVYKGDFESNEIFLITPGGIAEGEFMFVTDILELVEGNAGVFFTNANKLNGLAKDEVKTNTHFAKSIEGYFPKYYKGNNLSLGYGVLAAKAKYEKILESLGTPILVYPSEESDENPFEQDCSDLTTETQAEISFKNFEFSGNFETVEFDVMMKTNPSGLNFGKCEYKIKFPENIFGSFPIQNNTVEFSQGELTNGNNDYELIVIDEASNKINVKIELSGSSGDPVILSGEETQILHCIFTIEDPSLITELNLSDFEFEGQVWFDCKGRLTLFDRIKFSHETIGGQLGDVSIDFKLQKFSYREVNPNLKLLTFDIYASSNETQIINTAELFIDYGQEAFGSMLASNNTVGVQLDEIVSNYTIERSDENDNTLKLTLTRETDSDPALISANPQKLLTVTLRVEDCNEDANITWNALTENGNQTYLEGNEVMIYSPINFDGGLNTSICGCDSSSPSISSFSVNFSEAKIRAGTGEVLTIFGNNFGEVIVDESCYVEVANADHKFPPQFTFPNPNPGWSDTDRTRIPLNDIIDWTNTAITFTVPSVTLGATSAPVESGELIVFNECGQDDDDIDVEYAVMNIRRNGIANRVALEKQTEDGIQFSFASNVGSTERSLSQFAVNTWCVQANIGWSILSDNSTANSVNPSDGINLILEVNPEFSDFISGTTAAGVVVFGEVVSGENFTVSCNNLDNEEVYYVRNIELVINENINFSDMSLSESRRIFLHEFGHAALVQHASRLFGTGDPQKLMYYTSGNQNNSITSADLNGAISVIPASFELLGDSDSDECPAPFEAGCPNNTNEISVLNAINLSPNPFSENLFIRPNSSINEDLEIKIFSTTGNLLYSEKFTKNQDIKLHELNFLPNGIYFINIQSKSLDWSSKIIKQK